MGFVKQNPHRMTGLCIACDKEGGGFAVGSHLGQKGVYGNLMMLLRNEDVVVFRNFTLLSPQMFLDLVERLTPRLRKADTWYRLAGGWTERWL